MTITDDVDTANRMLALHWLDIHQLRDRCFTLQKQNEIMRAALAFYEYQTNWESHGQNNSNIATDCGITAIDALTACERIVSNPPTENEECYEDQSVGG